MLQMLLLAALGADPGAWGQAEVAGAGSYGSGPSIQTYSGLASASISAFLHHRLRDDDDPLSLQPYLQRAGIIGGSLSISGSSTESPNSAYVAWWLTRSFGLGLEYRFTHVEAVHQPGIPLDIHRGALTLGFRLG
jgi:hypothetical protein